MMQRSLSILLMYRVLICRYHLTGELEKGEDISKGMNFTSWWYDRIHEVWKGKDGRSQGPADIKGGASDDQDRCKGPDRNSRTRVRTECHTDRCQKTLVDKEPGLKRLALSFAALTLQLFSFHTGQLYVSSHHTYMVCGEIKPTFFETEFHVASARCFLIVSTKN